MLFSFKRCEHGGRDLASAGAEIQAVRLTSRVAWLAEPPAADLRFCERGEDLRRGDVEPSGMGEGTAKWRRHGVSLSSAPRAAHCSRSNVAARRPGAWSARDGVSHALAGEQIRHGTGDFPLKLRVRRPMRTLRLDDDGDPLECRPHERSRGQRPPTEVRLEVAEGVRSARRYTPFTASAIRPSFGWCRSGTVS